MVKVLTEEGLIVLISKLCQQKNEIEVLKVRISELESAIEQLNAAYNCCGYHD